MFSKSSVAGLAGMTLAASALAAPGVVATQTAGRAVAWGWNHYGQLGNNSTTASTVPAAVDTGGVLAGRTITAVSAGRSHTCAVADGRAYCWGENAPGQLGNNSTTDSQVPVAVDTGGVLAGKTVTAIATGAGHSCAVAEGLAYCWGSNANGRLGNGTTTDSLVPVAVTAGGVLAGKTITAISAGYRHSCVVADGKAYCWGENVTGALGNNSAADSWVPVAVKADSGPLAGTTITSISAGQQHSCAVADGKAYCWGENAEGQVGNGTTTDSWVPVAVKADSGPLVGKAVTAITTGYWHSCAVADGKPYCWGDNDVGQLGNNSTTDSPVPVAVDTGGVLAGKTTAAISAGFYHSCVLADGSPFCWGANDDSQFGNNTTTDSSVPVAVDTGGVLAGKTITALDSGGSHSVALAAAVPQPPASVGGVPGNRKVTVSWIAPPDDGGSPVLDYAATAAPGGKSCTSTGTSCVVSGLVNGTAYRFTVTARNAIGMSAPSAPSAAVTPRAAKPGKVTGVKAVAKKGRVKITWKRVTGATSYRARISRPGGRKYRTWKTRSKRVFKSTVREGTKYRFQVAAVGPGGRGPVTTIRFKGK